MTFIQSAIARGADGSSPAYQFDKGFGEDTFYTAEAKYATMLCSAYLAQGILQHDPLSNMRTLMPTLQLVYMTRAPAYRYALKVFMKREGKSPKMLEISTTQTEPSSAETSPQLP
nr:pectin acetylesterase 7 [Tanacetum cinerariifolium]